MHTCDVVKINEVSLMLSEFTQFTIEWTATLFFTAIYCKREIHRNNKDRVDAIN